MSITNAACNYMLKHAAGRNDCVCDAVPARRPGKQGSHCVLLSVESHSGCSLIGFNGSIKCMTSRVTAFSSYSCGFFLQSFDTQADIFSG